MKLQNLRLACLALSVLAAPVLAASSGPAVEPAIAAAFPGLNKVVAPHVEISLYYAPGLTEILEGAAAENKESEEIVGIADRPIRTKALGSSGNYFIIECDGGVSADPGCRVLQQLPSGKSKNVLYTFGSRFIIPGNGLIYVDGHVNTNFSKRRKFEWKGGEFVEVKQPFLYVGLDSTTVKSVTLFQERELRTSIAQLPTGSRVTVLLNVPDTDDYLLKTPFGLVGWARIETSQQAETIRGLFFNGD